MQLDGFRILTKPKRTEMVSVCSVDPVLAPSSPGKYPPEKAEAVLVEVVLGARTRAPPYPPLMSASGLPIYWFVNRIPFKE